jgi:hypothetical protein
MSHPASAIAGVPGARSHVGRASSSLAALSSVRRTSFSRWSSAGLMATQPASIRGRWLRVSVNSSRDASLRDPAGKVGSPACAARYSY